MLTELCQELRNWFDKKRLYGSFEIRDGGVFPAGNSILWDTQELQEGMYFSIFGSWFNDGVHQYPDYEMRPEVFSGSVWLMAVPKAVLDLADDIEAWRLKYEDVDSAAMSPFTSENYFGDYSYSKNAPGNSAGAGSSAVSWVSVFKARLNPWRKIL